MILEYRSVFYNIVYAAILKTYELICCIALCKAGISLAGLTMFSYLQYSYNE